jgi:hypothetical protein
VFENWPEGELVIAAAKLCFASIHIIIVNIIAIAAGFPV